DAAAGAGPPALRRPAAVAARRTHRRARSRRRTARRPAARRPSRARRAGRRRHPPRPGVASARARQHAGAGGRPMKGFLALVVRDLRLSLRVGGEALTLVLFFVMIGVVVPFAIGPDRVLLARLAPGIVWIAAFLSMLLGL